MCLHIPSLVLNKRVSGAQYLWKLIAQQCISAGAGEDAIGRAVCSDSLNTIAASRAMLRRPYVFTSSSYSKLETTGASSQRHFWESHARTNSIDVYGQDSHEQEEQLKWIIRSYKNAMSSMLTYDSAKQEIKNERLRATRERLFF